MSSINLRNENNDKLKKLQEEEKALRKLIGLVNDQIRSVKTEGLFLQYHLNSSDNQTVGSTSGDTNLTSTCETRTRDNVTPPSVVAVRLEDTLNLEVFETLKSYSQPTNLDQEIEEDDDL